MHNGTETSVEEQNEAACSVVEAIEQIGSQWRLIVLQTLDDAGEQRFSELERATGASSRTLSRVLEDLQEDGLVSRRVQEKPLATYYDLTAKGEALCPVFEALDAWAADWL